MRMALVAVSAILVAGSSHGALAQSRTAYQVGLQVAQARGASDPDCYARVFARHARVVEDGYGRRGWHAASTPQYNAEIQRRCGFDRRAAMRAGGPPARPVVARPAIMRPVVVVPAQGYGGGRVSANGHPAGGAYGSGLGHALKIGHHNPQCYAQVWSRYAYPVQQQDGKPGYWWRVDSTAAFRADMKSQCG